MILEIPLRPDLAHYDFSYTLDEVTYLFEFRWNSREEAWYFDLRLEDETDVLNGVKVVLGYPMGIRSRNANRPPGQLVAFDTSGRNEEAGLEDLGSRVIILYYDLEEVNEMREAAGLPTV
jgi:hypothetical protein